MEESDFVGHLCTPRNGDSNSSVTTHRSSKRKHGRRKRTRSLVRSKSHHDVTANQPLNPELSVDNRAPGLLKIFGESVVAGTRYKSVLASTRSTAQELIKQALDRYGIASRLYKDFVLCESIGKIVSATHCEGDFDSHTDKRKDKKGVLTSSSISSAEFHSSLPKSSSCTNTPRSARSLHGRKLKKLLNHDNSPCGSPRGNCDSPRTPLGSPRTPCGSPSTSRGSPRTSVVYHVGRTGQEDFDSTNYRPPKVLDSSSYGHQRNLLKHGRSGNDSPRIINNLGYNDSPRQNLRSPRVASSVQSKNDSHQNQGDWIQVYFRVLSYSDRPLELQEFWKPPDGLSRRYELKRRRDVRMDTVDNETTGLNDNARKIMISKVSPGVIPFNEPRSEISEVRTILKDEWNRAAAAVTNASLTYTEDNDAILTNVVEGDPRQAYVCPSIYPYLLTLRGCSIQKDLVLYPLKSRSLSIGSAEKKSHSDDIQLTAHDVNSSHCRVTLKRLPQDEKSVDENHRIYWYCLDLEIFGTSFVTVNGIQVRQKATIFPGDLLGIGRQYLFLYKDPTGGHDIPSAVPWLPENETEASAIYSQVIRHQQIENRNALPLSNCQSRPHQIEGHHLDVPYQEEDSNVLDDSAARETAIFLAYHRDKEMELLECISEVECHGKGDYPLSVALLFLASHQYAARKFSGNHQTTFFKRLVRVIRARVGVVSKLVSQQKHESASFGSDNSTKTVSVVDYFPCLVNWLSNVLTLLGHFRTSQFQSFVGSLARRNDVTKSVQEAVGYFEETISFLFQQVVYSVTKVLYDPINKFMQNAVPDNPKPSNEALRRILAILQAVRRLATDLHMKTEVANQLMVYLLFFVSTTLFNRIIAKGSKLYNRESGTVLQEGISALESWTKDAGLEQEFVRVSEHILSLVDLLSSSKRTLMRLDWHSFQSQFSPLTDIQLCKVLGEFNLGDGVISPESWRPPQPIDAKQDLTVSLSSHPPFVLPKQGDQVNLQDTFSPAFYRHLEQVQQRFSLVGEDAYCSGLSSAGNTPRLSESMNRSGNLDTFFSQDHNSSLSGGSSHLTSEMIKSGQFVSKSQAQSQNYDEHDGSHRKQSQHSGKRVPPQTAPKPKKGQIGVQISEPTSQRASAPPPYNMAMKLKQKAQSQENISKNNTQNKQTDSSKNPNRYPVVPQQNSVNDSKQIKSIPSNFHSNLHKFQTLPDNIKDKIFTQPTISNSHPHRSQHGRSRHLRTQQSWTQGSHQMDANHIIQTNNSDLLSTYPGNRPRPSSATDCMQYSSDNSNNENPDPISGPFMNPQQREELLTTRSNSALGYKADGQKYFQKQFSMPGGSAQNNRSKDQREHILHPPNYEHVKDSTSEMLEVNHHNSSHNHPNTQYVAESNDKVGLSKNKESENGLFTYGSLKRSPRNTNLSKQSSTDNKLNESGKMRSAESGRAISDNSDVPPPLPPRERKSSFGSQNDSARDKGNTHRESPLGSTLSSQRHRSGSRTSVEIQDITENQYIIYNPESPVKEFFDFNQNYLLMVNRNNVGENVNKQNESNPDTNRKLTRVPPLDLPDDLLGVSENESQDEVFNYSSDRDFVNEHRNISHKMQGLFGPSENVHPVNHAGSGNRTRQISSLDEYPDDVYIDVNNLSNSDSTGSSILKVLPLSDEGRRTTNNDPDAIFVRYRHAMPDPRDISSKGEVAGEVFTVSLTKTGNKLGMGLIDGLHTPLKLPGIYVRNVLPDTPAALCGCLRVGDRLLSINGKSIVGVDYNSAMKLIHSAGTKLDLMVAKCDRSIASKISASNS